MHSIVLASFNLAFLLSSCVYAQDGTNGICNTSLATYVTTEEQTAVHGLVFAIESALTDPVGSNVLSMGFHVSPALMVTGSFQYEVYALDATGYYADPDRGESILSQLSYDYRGVLDSWSLIARGGIYENDLQVSETTPQSTQEVYYEIPMESFVTTSVPPNGGQRSFYVTLKTAGLVTAEPGDSYSVNDESILLPGEGDSMSPRILIGESSSSYPFGDVPYLYAPAMFMGKVLFEKACPTESPSISIAPSFAPSNVASESPSGVPSSSPSVMPSDLPSYMPSMQPTIMPSSIPSMPPTYKAEEVRSGLLLSLEGPECDPSADVIEMSQSEQNAVAETVKANAEADAEENDVYNVNVEVVGISTTCERRRLSGRSYVKGQHHRQLPSGAAAVEFSMVITGEYRPPVIPGETPKPKPRNLDLGAIAQESINRDPEGFVRDLKSRAPPDSALNDVKELEIEAVEAPPEGEEVVFTKKPTLQPTSPPFQSVIYVDDGNSVEKTILLACIIATSGMIVILCAFLFFRVASRRAIKRHDAELERQAKQWEDNWRKYNEAHVEWTDDDLYQ